jgi:hypothetical protein
MTRAKARRSKEKIAMGQITLFPRARHQSRPGAPVDEVMLVGVDAGLCLADVPQELVRISDELGIRYLAEWELAAAELEPVSWVVPRLPSQPDRRVIAITIGDEVIEQDQSGSLRRDGRPIGEGALLSYCGVRSQDEQNLGLGERAGWLLGRMEAESFVLSVHVSEPLLWIYERPAVLGVLDAFNGWMLAATHVAERVGSREGVCATATAASRAPELMDEES